jgi:hypothetical protein
VSISEILGGINAIRGSLPEFTQRIVLKEIAWIIGKWLRISDADALLAYIW